MASRLQDLVIFNDPKNTSGEKGRTAGFNGYNEPIPNVGDPVNNKDATNKEWTETQIQNAVSAIQIPNYSWKRILSRSSLVDQIPAGLDIPLQINFGTAFNPPNNEVSLSATGDITINQTGFYRMCVALTLGRSAATASADILLRSLKNAQQLHFYDGCRLDDNDNIRTTMLNPIDDNFVATDVIHYEIKRGTGGENDGGLFAITDAGNPSWGTLPSATLTIYKFVETIT